MLEGFTRSFEPLEILSEGELETIHRGGLYTLENTGGSSISWQAGVDQTWGSLSVTAGTLSAGGSRTINLCIEPPLKIARFRG